MPLRAKSLVLALPFVVLGGCRSKDAAEVQAARTITADTLIGAPTSKDTVVEYYTAAALAHVGDSLARGSTSGHMLRAHDTYQYLQIRRARSGVPEVHDRWTDVTMVQSGRASLLSGGRVDGSHVESPGEHRGGTITGGTTRAVGPGDLMIIPAGIPHQYVIAPGDSLRYVTVKIRATAGPH
jgi:mannose-6-phosphate isomerase-like protein (cupin superfamily)